MNREKREHARTKALVDFFKEKGSTGYRKGGRSRSFGGLSAVEIFRIIQHLNEKWEVVEDLLKFVRSHKKIAREMTVVDVEEAVNELTVSEVMES
jgi:hypothetical protein